MPRPTNGRCIRAPARPRSAAAATSSTCRWRPARIRPQFRRACTETLLPAIEAFAPQLLLVSAGFDAHRLDPLANLDLEDDDYAWLSAALVAIAERHAGGRLVSTLEGGYSLTALRHAATVHCRALFGTTPP